MTALDDLREKIATARAIGEPFGMVVLTAAEAQAVVDQIDGQRAPRVRGEPPPYEGDDEHAH